MKHIVICGGFQGLGNKLVGYFNSLGWSISVIDLQVNQEMVSEKIQFFCCDLTNYTDTQKIIQKIVREKGEIDAFVNCVRFRKNKEDDIESSWHKGLNGDLSTYFNAVIAATEFMKVNGGAIVLVSSILSKQVTLQESLPYHTAKAGINQMTKYLAVKYGPFNIRINAVLPGLISNEQSEKASLEEDASTYSKIAHYIPLKRSGSPEEVCKLIHMLVSKNSSYITGQEIIIDGGLSLLDQCGLIHKTFEVKKQKISSSF